MISCTVGTVQNNVHVNDKTQFGVNLQRESVIVTQDGEVVIAMKVWGHQAWKMRGEVGVIL